MKLLDNITYWMDMNLSHFQKIVEDRGDWLGPSINPTLTLFQKELQAAA